MNPTNGGWVILLSILVAMVLGVAHLPESWPQWLGWLRPQWLLLVLFFWVVELPDRVGLIAAWFIGLFYDALVGSMLGVNAAIFAAVTYVAWKFYERLRMYSVFQQCLVVFALATGAEIIRSVLAGGTGVSVMILVQSGISMLLWPPLYLLMLRLRIAARVE